jgi:hypothetical protein
MARFQVDPKRQNFAIEQKGREFNLRLVQRSQAIFTALLNLLPSNYTSAVQGPAYTNELKCVAIELSRIELALEDVDRDRSFETTRSDFLYSLVGYLMFANSRLPPLQWNDEEFRGFLLNLVAIYFQGSIPKSIRDVTSLLLSGDVRVTENFLLVRGGASGYDISDQFGFGIDVVIPEGGGFPANLFDVDTTLRLLLDIVRPAHTLFRIRFVFSDKYIPPGTGGKIIDAMHWHMSNYQYEDFRRYCNGIRDRDRLGRKTNQSVTNEDHSSDYL